MVDDGLIKGHLRFLVAKYNKIDESLSYTSQEKSNNINPER